MRKLSKNYPSKKKKVLGLMKNTNEKAEEHSSLKKIEEIFTKKYNV